MGVNKSEQGFAAQPEGVRAKQTLAGSIPALVEADLCLPAHWCGGLPYVGSLRNAPTVAPATPSPVVLFLHGSGGLHENTRSWQRWLAMELNLPSLAPNSLAQPDRIRYQSPVAKEVYERVHATRAAELQAGLECLRACSWVDPHKVVVAGTSEGAVAVARMEPGLALGRILYSWSCESNYFVEQHGTRFGAQEPVLNVVSTDDPYFRPENPWNAEATDDLEGHAGASVKGNPNATIVLISGAPHTLYNLSPARHSTKAFLSDLLLAIDLRDP